MDIKTIGVKGSGQLAQMLAQSANKLGYSIRSAGKNGSCAFSDCKAFTKDLKSSENIEEFLRGIDVFTFESEHEGLEIIDQVKKHEIKIFPPAEFVKIAGDRLLEKTELQKLNIPTAPFVEVDASLNVDQLSEFLQLLLETKKLSDSGIVVKTRHGGYDGKGQWVITNSDFDENAISEIHRNIASPGCIVEGLVNFQIEVSILATRSQNGEIKTWPLTHNIHKDSILQFSYCPTTGIENIDEMEKQAHSIVQTLCEKTNYVGTIAVECFVTNNSLIVNEIAPRVHNSGHWTIEGSQTSQFENHIRAITGLELGDTDLKGFCAMINLVGVEIDPADFKDMENVYLHWYGKEVREKRKVGHITVVGTDEIHCKRLVEQVLTKVIC